MDGHVESRLRLKTIIIALVVTVLGLGSLVVSLQMAAGFWQSLFRELTTVLLVGVVVHLAYEFFQRRDVVAIAETSSAPLMDSISQLRRDVMAKLRIAQAADQIGLYDTKSDANQFDYSEMLEHANSLTIVLNDGRTWISNNTPRLRKRIADPLCSTRFIVIHPQSPMMTVLARKEGTTEDALRHKIEETVTMLKQLQNKDSKLTVFGHYLFNPHSVFLGDRYAVISPYFHSRGRRTVPAYRFNDRDGDCYYKELGSDIESLLIDAEQML